MLLIESIILRILNKYLIFDSRKQKITFGTESEPVGPAIQTLYRRVRAIQNGEEMDKFGWMFEV